MVTEVDFYVRTSADAGGDGSTNTDSSGDNSHAYQSFAAFEAAEQDDLTTATGSDKNYTVHCSVGSGSAADTAASLIFGWTLGPGTSINVIGEGNDNGKYDTTKYRGEITTSGSYQWFITSLEDSVTMTDLQAKYTSSNGAHNHCYAFGDRATSSNTIVDRCLVALDSNIGATENLQGGLIALHSSTVIKNSLVYEIGNLNEQTLFGTGKGTIQNCTAIDGNIGFTTQHLQILVENCLAQGCTDGYQASFNASSTNNASDITSDAPATNRQTGSVTFVDASGFDFTPASGDTIAKENGKDLSGSYTLDLAGNTWNATFDIGALRVAAAASGGIILRNPSTNYLRHSLTR